MRRQVTLLAVLLLLPASFASAGSADTAAPRFTIEGRVLDPLKAPIAGARVTAVADGQAQGVGTMSDARGDFSLSLPTGAYTLSVQADGFTAAAQHIASPDSGSVSLRLRPRDRRLPRPGDGERAGGLPGPGHHHGDEDADAAARRAAVGHRRDARS